MVRALWTFTGHDASLDPVREKLHQMNAGIDAWEAVSRSTDG